MTGQVAQLVGATAQRKTSAGLELTEVSVSVGFTASGQLGFIEAGIEASVTLVFSRPEKPANVG